ncbi:aspartic proteinase nepenthesin-1 [Malania oleifera]|uniref:aspartic proteinase nepenthesin-1 n=1 Tax=Malania oleifera TaxID=397392 RepID=UPI0025ADE4AE|nr:aspartic proteinase nepenthesin-1 [Malania oleifera]
MASSSSPLLAILVTAVAVLMAVSLPPPALSTSRRALDNGDAAAGAGIGFRVALRHVDSEGNFTKFELLQRAIKRGRHRLHRLSSMALAGSPSSSNPAGGVEAPVRAGSGEFLMKLSIGTPAESFSAIMDTGSDLIWTQCKPCQECFDQPTPIFDPKKSSSFSKLSCSSSLCTALPASTCSDGCEYLYTYGDYSSTQGVMATETFSFGDDAAALPKVAFGCGEDNEGDGFVQGAGLVGLGRGPLSLVSQLDELKFSYCLTSIDDTKSSSLLMGSAASTVPKNSNSAVTTPLLKNPSQPSFYYLGLEGITVGSSRLDIAKSTFALQDDGSGGLIIDSGTTITYLEDGAFEEVKKAFVAQVKLAVDESGAGGLDLCFTLPSGTAPVKVPKMVLHFQGEADLELPAENYMIADQTVGLMCLAMGSSSGMSILGNVQQQNMMVVHDLQKETLSFVPTKCNKL